MPWVFFDIGGPLYDEDENVADYYEQIRLHFNLTPEQLEQEKLEAKTVRADNRFRFIIDKHSKDGVEAEKSFWAIRAKRTGIGLKKLRPGVIELLDWLKSHSCGLGVIANQPVEIRSIMERDNILRFFDVVIISEEVKLEKPNPRIFQLAMERAGAKPAECWFVGDRIDNDIKPAKKAGMHTVWVRGVSEHDDEAPKDESEQPEAEIRALADLKKLMWAAFF